MNLPDILIGDVHAAQEQFPGLELFFGSLVSGRNFPLFHIGVPKALVFQYAIYHSLDGEWAIISF